MRNLWANADAAREYERNAFGAYADGCHRDAAKRRAAENEPDHERQEGQP